MKDIKPGVYPDLSNADYHGSNGISKTGLDLFNKDQSSLEWAKNCPVDSEKLKTLDFGDAMHAICLEPDRLNSDFIVMPPFNLRTNVGKEEKKAFESENEDKRILTSDEYKKLELMYGSVMANLDSRHWLECDGIAEQSYYWVDPDTDVLCKCRPDRNIFNTNALVDVKTTDDLKKFDLYSIPDYRYHVQDPFYCDGVTACGEEKDLFVFIVIQKTIELGRYPVRCVVLPRKVTEFGRSQYKRDLENYAIAKETGDFNGLHFAKISRNFQYQIDHS